LILADNLYTNIKFPISFSKKSGAAPHRSAIIPKSTFFAFLLNIVPGDLKIAFVSLGGNILFRFFTWGAFVGGGIGLLVS